MIGKIKQQKSVCVCVALFNSTYLLFNLVAWYKMESFVVTIKQVDEEVTLLESG